MKDKSRFLSSVIVSLLAGFMYYMFGQDITENFQSSVKAVLSSNGMEEYMPTECAPFNTVIKNSPSKTNKKKSKFYIKKRNTIEFKNQDVTIPGDELFSDYVQAKFQRPVADRNVDFTAELEQLIKNDVTKTTLKPGKETKIAKSLSGKDNVVADTKEIGRSSENFDEEYEVWRDKVRSVEKRKGNGFEFNMIAPDNTRRSKTTGTSESESMSESEATSNEGESSELNFYKSENDCEQFKMEFKTKTKIINGKKVKIITPKIHIKTDTEEFDVPVEPEEINLEDDSSCDDTM